MVYATDGENNPWPRRVIDRKWRLHETDRERWGKLRRTEALAALDVLGVNASEVSFLALPDQKLTKLLMSGCGRTLERCPNQPLVSADGLRFKEEQTV